MQSPIINHQSAIPQPASDRIRQNTTECHKMQRNLVRTRSLIHAHAREVEVMEKRDSRLRGNDVGRCGNDVGGCGNPAPDVPPHPHAYPRRDRPTQNRPGRITTPDVLLTLSSRYRIITLATTCNNDELRRPLRPNPPRFRAPLDPPARPHTLVPPTRGRSHDCIRNTRPCP